jgi:succinate dehydrogenase / fumarate reductase cytochrome b subunit
MIGPYYRPQWTSISSITVRITAIAALIAGIFVVLWLLAAATSAEAFATADGLMRSILGDIVMFGAAWAIFYHMLGRLRHVIWDFGYGLEVKPSEYMAMGMFALATVFAVLVALLF